MTGRGPFGYDAARIGPAVIRVSTPPVFVMGTALAVLVGGCIEQHPEYVDPASEPSETSTSTVGADTTDTSSGDESTGDTGDTGDPETGTTDDPQPGMKEYPASIGLCIDPANLDPALCEESAGLDQVSVDAYTSVVDGPWISFLRFDFDDSFEGRTVTTATLQMVVGPDDKDEGSSTGDVWQVEPFTEADLLMKVPAQVGNQPIAFDRGPVGLNETVVWGIPEDLIEANGSLYLGMWKASENGTDYWGKDGVAPPLLIVEWN